MRSLPRLTDAKAADRADRERRLAEALRKNLHRRKERARATSPAAEAAPKAEDEPSP